MTLLYLTGLSFLAAVASHAVLVRLACPGSAVLKFFLAGGAVGLLLACHVLAAFGFCVTSFAVLSSYAFLCELYIFLFTMTLSSVSVKMLFTLRKADLTPEELAGLYQSRGMVAGRIQRLLAVGLLQQEGPLFRVTPRGRRLVLVFTALQRFFGHAPRQRFNHP
jgi:hypothetical protein